MTIRVPAVVERRGRVLHIGKFFPPDRGGIESYLADLMDAQRGEGMEVAAIVHGEPLPDDPPWLIRVPVQAQLVYAPIALGMGLALRRAIAEFKPDVLHLHMPNLAVFWALFLPRAVSIPWVVHWHSDVMVNPERVLLHWAYRFYEPLERRMLRGAQAIIATSPTYLLHSNTLWPWRGKTAAIPLGLKLLPGVPTPEVLAQQQRDARPDPSIRPMQVLSIGRLAHYKGFATLIDAVAHCAGIELQIIGDGELRGALESQIAELPLEAAQRIRLLGGVDEASKCEALAACDLFALASTEKSEAFGLVVLEAMQFGKPCLVSELSGSGLPWVVGHAQAGRTAPVGDVVAWHQALQAMQAEWQQAMRHPAPGAQWLTWSRNACAAANGFFSMQSNARLVQAVYEKLWPEWRPAQHGVLVVLPVCNVAGRVADRVRELQAAGWHEVLVVDQGSSDGTGEAAQAAGARVVSTTLELELWGAIQLGLRWARERCYAKVITVSMDEGQAQELHALLAHGEHDLVIGAWRSSRNWLRRMAWAWFRGVTGLRIHDMRSVVRLYGREAVAVLASREATMLDYQDMGTLLLLQRSRLSMVEVNVTPPANLPRRGLKSGWDAGRYLLASVLLAVSRSNTPPWRPRALAPKED